jgi:hypothetical protein
VAAVAFCFTYSLTISHSTTAIHYSIITSLSSSSSPITITYTLHTYTHTIINLPHTCPNQDGSPPVFCDDRKLTDSNNVVVTYHNPLDNVADLAHHFFTRCLEGKVVPYVVTKKTVFKWQEGFW